MGPGRDRAITTVKRASPSDEKGEGNWVNWQQMATIERCLIPENLIRFRLRVSGRRVFEKDADAAGEGGAELV